MLAHGDTKDAGTKPGLTLTFVWEMCFWARKSE